jgi:peptidoglycan/xylan/chitin deacetylase (PgdA/CDA1 family)
MAELMNMLNLPVAAGASAAALAAIGAGVYGTMWPSSQWFGGTLVAGENPNELALTFDDGPNGDTTERLLELLARHQAKATFFLVGKFVQAQPALARRIAEQGHALGNHTMTHPRLLLQGPTATHQEIADGGKAIADATGVEAKIFRPPFGGRWPHTLRAARELGLVPVMWNALGMDWKETDAAKVASRLLNGMERNRREGRATNFLMHDGSHRGIGANREATLGAVERILQQESGKARFVTVGEWM